jgi:GntR family transcriptional regulator, rspAB operon transcriptional repressor
MRSSRRSLPGFATRVVPDLRPLNARIHAWLREAILDLALLPGEPIVEADVAARFDASRTPVREALLRLSDEELVEIRPQRGTYVARLSLARIESAMFIRQAIECAVLRRLASGEQRGALVRSLSAIVRRHSEAVDGGEVRAGLDADTEFHRTLIEASGLPGVWDVVARARELHHRIRAIAVPTLNSGVQAVAEHRRVVAALKRGDADAAERALLVHLGRNVALARTIAARHPAFFLPEAVAPAKAFALARGTNLDLNQRLRDSRAPRSE